MRFPLSIFGSSIHFPIHVFALSAHSLPATCVFIKTSTFNPIVLCSRTLLLPWQVGILHSTLCIHVLHICLHFPQGIHSPEPRNAFIMCLRALYSTSKTSKKMVLWYRYVCFVISVICWFSLCACVASSLGLLFFGDVWETLGVYHFWEASLAWQLLCLGLQIKNFSGNLFLGAMSGTFCCCSDLFFLMVCLFLCQWCWDCLSRSSRHCFARQSISTLVYHWGQLF